MVIIYINSRRESTFLGPSINQLTENIIYFIDCPRVAEDGAEEEEEGEGITIESSIFYFEERPASPKIYTFHHYHFVVTVFVPEVNSISDSAEAHDETPKLQVSPPTPPPAPLCVLV